MSRPEAAESVRASRRDFWLEVGVGLAAFTVPLLIRGLVGSCRVTLRNRQLLVQAKGGEPFIGVVWHEHLIFLANVFRGTGFTVLVSRSRDGEIGTRIAHRLGLRTVRGSSSRGGEEALGEIVDLARGGTSIGFIADGPRGPRRELKLGAIIAAKLSGRPIVPITCAMRRAVRLNSWDRMQIPLPFTRIVGNSGDPIHVPADASRAECERIRREVQEEMLKVEAIAAASL
ncbi:MAG TPA: lysophospholipid acyltransferase family protein [Burkholderiales bacterium]|nr:lysophospholipid acyltransferase family protein [Burkholderiales bacterium]